MEAAGGQKLPERTFAHHLEADAAVFRAFGMWSLLRHRLRRSFLNYYAA
jgi:hypothetical protein